MAEIKKEKVDFQILIRADKDEVFRAIATSEGFDEWFTSNMLLETKAGGKLEFRWKDWGLNKYTGEIAGKVIEYDASERFVFQWLADSGTYYTTVEIELSLIPEGTRLHLIEYGYEDTDDGMQDLLNRVSGWASVMTMMKYYVEHGVRY